MSIAKFTHVSDAQYAEAMQGQDCLPLAEIPLPKRATAGSAGYCRTCVCCICHTIVCRPCEEYGFQHFPDYFKY